MSELHIYSQILNEDEMFPNNQALPLLVYQSAVELSSRDPASRFEHLFSSHHWSGSWRNGIYSFHHYHSIAHEVLGVYSGTAKVQLGGEQGVIVTANPGDVILIPAGVAHKNLGASRDFGVVGAYPTGQYPDMCYGKPEERPQADERIAHVAMPNADPIYGQDGPIFEYWNA